MIRKLPVIYAIRIFGMTFVGTLLFVEEKKLLWSVQVDEQLFCLTKLDITVCIDHILVILVLYVNVINRGSAMNFHFQ